MTRAYLIFISQSCFLNFPCIPHNDYSDYVPFVVNKALSAHLDCVLLANEMNEKCHLSKKMQYKYLLNKVRKCKRPYSEWMKKQKTIEDVENLKEYYGYSTQKAEDVLRLHSQEQLEQIRIFLSKGGVNKNG